MSYIRPKRRGVYAIACVSTEAAYVGSSVDIIGRYTHHRFYLRRGIHKNPRLQALWNETGEENFRFLIVEECDTARLLDREKHFIALIGTLNICVNASAEGRTYSPEQKQRFSETAKRRWNRQEYREKQRAVPRDKSTGRIVGYQNQPRGVNPAKLSDEK